MKLQNFAALIFLGFGLAGCVTSTVNPRVTLKDLPPDRCLASYGPQARETITGSGTSCVIYVGSREMKQAERKYTTSVANLAKQKLTEGQKKQKSDQLMATWYSEAGKAASKTACPKGMRKAADYIASSVTCTAWLGSNSVVQ